MIMLPNKTSEVVHQRALQRTGAGRFWYCNLIVAICMAGFWTGCATNPPPLPPGNPADPQITGHARTPRNLLARDETTLAIEKELSLTESTAKSSESMQHEGMQHGGMQGMQDEGMKMEQPS